jgi:hypothetical protein
MLSSYKVDSHRASGSVSVLGGRPSDANTGNVCQGEGLSSLSHRKLAAAAELGASSESIEAGLEPGFGAPAPCSLPPLLHRELRCLKSHKAGTTGVHHYTWLRGFLYVHQSLSTDPGQW